jgi:hypothetical protein
MRFCLRTDPAAGATAKTFPVERPESALEAAQSFHVKRRPAACEKNHADALA